MAKKEKIDTETEDRGRRSEVRDQKKLAAGSKKSEVGIKLTANRKIVKNVEIVKVIEIVETVEIIKAVEVV